MWCIWFFGSEMTIGAAALEKGSNRGGGKIFCLRKTVVQNHPTNFLFRPGRDKSRNMSIIPGRESGVRLLSKLSVRQKRVGDEPYRVRFGDRNRSTQTRGGSTRPRRPPVRYRSPNDKFLPVSSLVTESFHFMAA